MPAPFKCFLMRQPEPFESRNEQDQDLTRFNPGDEGYYGTTN